MPQHTPRTRRAGNIAAAVRDTQLLVAAIAESGMSRRQIAHATKALSVLDPKLYEAVTYQTLNNLVSGKQAITGVERAQAIAGALRVPAGNLFTVDFTSDQKASA